MTGRRARLAAGLLAAGAVALSAASGGETFDDAAFQRIVRDVLKDAKTNSERAERLHDTALSANGRLQIALLEKAYDYGRTGRPGFGFDHAEKAVKLLEQKDSSRRAHWRRQRLDLYRQAFRRLIKKTITRKSVGSKLVALLLAEGKRREGSGKWQEAADAYREAKFPAHTLNLFVRHEISWRFSRATHFAVARRRADLHLRRLAKNPADGEARRKLVQTLVVDLDAPAEAAKHLTQGMDEAWRTYVKLAAGPVSRLAAPAARELGDWYYQVLLPKAASFSQGNVLRRVKGCYERFLATAAKGDAHAARIRVLLARVDRAIEEHEADVRWVDLMRYVDVAAGAVGGTAKETVDGPRVTAPAQRSTVLPIAAMPEGSYELEVSFIRHAWGRRPDSVHITCPVGRGRSFNVILDGYGRHLAGFENIQGDGGSTLRENGTAVTCSVSNGREYTVLIAVTLKKDTADIVVRLRGSKLMSWSGPLSSVLAPDLNVPFGLGAGWNTSITYTGARLRMIEGELKAKSQAGASTRPGGEPAPPRREPPGSPEPPGSHRRRGRGPP